MLSINKKIIPGLLPAVLTVLLLAGMIGLLAPATAYAAGGDLTISGPGLNNPDGVTITQQQLRGNEALPPELQVIHGQEYLRQHDEWYSTINTWPTKSWYRGEGVKLSELLELAGGLSPEATQIRFTANDGFKATFTVQELLVEPRYRFPNFINYDDAPDHLFGHVPGDSSDAVQVETIIAHQSFYAHDLEDIIGPYSEDNFSRGDANHLLYGQRAVTQQTNARFAKYTVGIEVLTDPVLVWDNPTASVEPGEVPVGTLVELHSPFDDEDKVHYTLDGSDPTMESPMYNWIAKRWWSSREQELPEINSPIEITEDTTIKAFVTGPGRADSEIVTFEYTVPRVAVTGVSITEGDQELEEGQTVQLSAVVEPEDATDKSVTWSSSDESVATVSESGMVTAVSVGTAEITVATTDGGFTDSIAVTVIPVAVTGISIPEGDQILLKGATVQLSAVVEPDNAADKSVTWNSDNESVATVSETGLVTAVSEGTAEITVATVDRGLTAKIKVAVVLVRAETTSEGDVKLTFTEAMIVPAGAKDRFTVRVDDEHVTVTEAVYGAPPEIITLVLDPKITGGQTATVDYSKSNDEDKQIKSADDGKVLESFEGLQVINYLTLPVLRADTSNNVLGQPVELTFEDNPVWRSNITGIIIDDTPDGTINGTRYDSDSGKYTVSAGMIIIVADVFTSAKDYEIYVEANGYDVVSVTQTINKTGSTPGLKAPPALNADEKVVGQEIKLTFADNADWQDAINSVFVDGISIAAGKYSVGSGVITIDAGLFPTVGSYTIVVKANGYDDATVTQKIIQGDITLTITGAVGNGTKTFTLAELEAMPQHQVVYTTINTWPTKKWYVGRGVKLDDLFEKVGGINPGATLVKFSAKDGFQKTLTVEQLKEPRYRFPNFKTGGDADGHIPGDPSGAVTVDTILGLQSVENSTNASDMNKTNAPLLMLGQRAVTEQTCELFVKYVNKIEVFTDSVPKWEKPTAIPAPGEVPAGTKVELHSPLDDADKVHYTLDGSTPDLNSPMFNWVASRWWSARGEETVKEINKPIVLTKDTTIKAVTIGPGRLDSDIVTFTYKVTKPVTSGKITSGTGGKVSFGDEAAIELPPGALTGSEAEVTIEKVIVPPAVPRGFKLLSDVFDFSVDGKSSYTFAKEVTITLSFDPEALGEGEIPSVYYYDETLGEWVNLGGEVSGNTITIKVDHLTKFAVMAALPAMATATVKPGTGGIVSLGDEALIEIPVGALTGSKAVEVKIERLSEPPAAAPAGFKLLGSVYEFTIDGKGSYTFAKEVTIELGFNPEEVGKGQSPSIHYYDEALLEWIELGGKISGKAISVEVDHLSKYAVMVSLPASVTATIEPGTGGIVSLGDEAAIEIPAGALAGSEAVDVKIERLSKPPAIPAGFKLLSDVFEFSVNGKKWYRFAGEVTIRLGFDPKAAAGVEGAPVISHYDDFSRRWIDLGGEVSGHTVTVKVDHFTKFAVMAKTGQELSDIAGHWAEASVKELVGLGAISGYPDGTFKPDRNITRAEFVTALVKAFTFEVRGGENFADTAEHWAKDYIAAAVANGIAGGFDDNTFRPNDVITREQMAAMVVRAAEVPSAAGEPSFNDSGSISSWAEEAIVTATENGIMKGYPDNTFRPRGSATRAEAAVVIINALHMIPRTRPG